MNESPKYAPGPYVVVREKEIDRPCKLYLRAGSRSIIASAVDDEEAIAQFQLFAAAPEMLEALKLAYQVINDLDHVSFRLYDLSLHIKDAVIKAEGAQQ